MDLYLAFDRPLEERHLAPLRDMTKRRGDREPLQHILGNVDFMGKEFLSDKRALIPRPETEELVGILFHQYKNKKEPSDICDVGCGSGVIGISLANHWPDSNIEMIDLRKIENRICDFYIICSGSSNTHVSAILESVKK